MRCIIGSVMCARVGVTSRPTPKRSNDPSSRRTHSSLHARHLQFGGFGVRSLLSDYLALKLDGGSIRRDDGGYHPSVAAQCAFLLERHDHVEKHWHGSSRVRRSAALAGAPQSSRMFGLIVAALGVPRAFRRCYEFVLIHNVNTGTASVSKTDLMEMAIGRIKCCVVVAQPVPLVLQSVRRRDEVVPVFAPGISDYTLANQE